MGIMGWGGGDQSEAYMGIKGWGGGGGGPE